MLASPNAPVVFYKYTHIMYNMSMNVKSSSSHLLELRRFLESQHGILLTTKLASFNIPRTYVSILEQSGEIERISRGIYQSAGALEDEMFTFQARYKSSVFSHETALYLHDLTDRSPLTYSITVPVGYHSVSLRQSGHKVFYLNRNLLDLGVLSLKSSHGNLLKTTNLERTICDVVRSRNQLDIQMVNTALKKYASRRDRDLDRLYHYARQFRILRLLRERMEVLL